MATMMLVGAAFAMLLNTPQGFRMNPSVTLRNNGATALQMASYSSQVGVPMALVEERDACGVGFIASLKNKASHSVVQQALVSCDCMEHRGATSADMISGDGAGLLTAIPWELFAGMVTPGAVKNGDGTSAAAVGMLFIPRDPVVQAQLIPLVEKLFAKYDFEVKGWRDVPVDRSVLGQLAAEFAPDFKQIVVQAKPGKAAKTQTELDKRLYNVRREIQGNFRQMGQENAYTCSLSTKTIVYKGMLRSVDLGKFYKDLKNPAYKTSFAVYHRRFSTNTVPKWFLAQPMRLLAHNGEINTLLGNINWVKSRQYAFRNARKASQRIKCMLTEMNQGEDSSDCGPVSGVAQEVNLQNERPDQIIKTIKGPLVDVGRSDSANLDSVLDSYIQQGFSAEQALMILVPEAYGSQPFMKDSPEVEAFYSYYESIQEAWDGPALLVFADGDVVGASLDRNGLRPARYMVTEQTDSDGEQEVMVHMMSEVGVTKALSQFDKPASEVNVGGPQLIGAGRLGPGEMLSVNLKEGKLYLNDALKKSMAAKQPYQEWAKKVVIPLARKPFKRELDTFAAKFSGTVPADPYDTSPVATTVDEATLIDTLNVFGWGTEDVEFQIHAMASTANEATFSMGDDAPLAALSSQPHTLYDYFKQRFAQVTNPAIDPLREGAVMSLNMFLGPRTDPTIYNGPVDFAKDKRIKIESPLLNEAEMESVANEAGMKVSIVSTLYPLTTALSKGGLKSQIDVVCENVVAAVRAGANIIDLSDKSSGAFDSSLTYIPPLVAVSAVHHRLIAEGLRTNCSIVATTGQAWSTHHVALLVGYGASAVVPYGAYDAVVNWHGQKRNQNAMAKGDLPNISAGKAIENYRKAVDKGLLKILSKMGISLLTSYHGAQIFEALGLADEVVMETFKGTPCRVSGLTYDDIAAETAEFSRKVFGDGHFAGMVEAVESAEQEVEGEELEGVPTKKLFNYGFLNYFKTGEYHHNNQPLIKTLHSAIRTGDLDLYNQYENAVKSRPPTTFRDTLQFNKKTRTPIPLDRVESAETIMKRFCTGGMSLGALSREAHETLAIGMNRIGGRSNSGEGGEDEIRRVPITDVDEHGMSATFPHLKGLKNGDRPGSRVKQVASGRFGVTPAYLMSAEQLEIKIAQGAKPGEGGQLPGAKIDAYIANLRASKPGVTLISPPPHHDIYSIEDLAQLIYDLHQINEKAQVSVKLVSEVGIGTVASGVTKAGADIIQIAGHDGGTGASPLSSIKSAGSPWELGLVETHSTLARNGLRDRVLLRVDGGLKTGWDVVMAAAMGAEEYGFGTIALIAEGCIMARICHTNKCPVGVTTQNEKLRARFPGTPENIVTFFGYVAEEVRHILAELGYTSLNEIIGRPGVLEAREGQMLKKTSSYDVSYVLDSLVCIPKKGENFCEAEDDRLWLVKPPNPNSNGFTFDDALLANKETMAVIESNSGSSHQSGMIKNQDRAAFARVSGQIATRWGDRGFNGNLKFDLTGGAGQSFCAFLGKGMEVTLTGYANDYVGKSMAGGRVIVRAPAGDLQASKDSKLKLYGGASPSAAQAQFNLVGNTVLYGATGGELMVAGRAGERFAVRNSGALGVVEGIGDHGCEYMTAGTIVNLGDIGRNFGAGMTGGLAFVVADEAWMDSDYGVTKSVGQTKTVFSDFINSELVKVMPLDTTHAAAAAFLKETLTRHADSTGSHRAAFLLANFDKAIAQGMIVAVVPNSEKENPLILPVVDATVSVSSSVAV